jgi:hypothetical protein
MEKAKITKDAKGSYIVTLHGFEFHVMRFGHKWEVEGHDTREAVGPGTFEGSNYEAAELALDRANANNRHPHTTTTLKAMVAWLEAHITPEPTPVEPTPAVDLGATRNVLDSQADLAADDLLFAEMETRHAHLPPVSDSVNTLRSALSTNGLKWRGNTTETLTRLTVEVGVSSHHTPSLGGQEIYEVIRQVLHNHGVEGAGLSGGPLEVYPLQDGTTFVVDWVSMESTHAVLTIVRMSGAF